MLRPILAAAAVATLAAAVFATAPACNGSVASGGGGGGASAYCSAASAYAQKCMLTDPCTQATVRDCDKVAPNLSAAGQAAVQACFGSAACPVDGGMTMNNDCFAQNLANAQPTAAQEKLAQDVCNVCAPAMSQTVAQCTASFYTTVDGSAGNLGQLFLYYSDDLVTKVDQTCVPTLADAGALCSLDSVFCGALVVQQNGYQPPECMQDAGGIQFNLDSGGGG